ncbi:MAG: transglutaminase-like domain-containing protein [Bacteroidales bacterium]|nr:transglutaminase-like domain-containing protein [Bacteroidales bacterium]
MKKLFIPLVVFLIASCCPKEETISLQDIYAQKAAGNFTQAKKLIDYYIAQNSLDEIEVYHLYAAKDTMDRIVVDFNRTKEDVLAVITPYYPDVTDEMLEKWEKEKSLESMVIDGEKRYFSRGAPNLFRIDAEAKARRTEVSGPFINRYDSILAIRLPQLITTLSKSGKTQGDPVKMKVKYSLTLRPNVIPEGETVRCWLPYPREDHRRQNNVKLLSVNSDNYIISPHDYAHRTLYMEKVTEKDEPLVFSLEFTYSSIPEWFNLSADKVKPYNTQSELYQTYTAEREQHIVFTDKIKEVSAQVVGDETNPFLKVKKIFEWIDSNYPWAGAREYSTLPNIPMYVLENNHGDCGQVSLLFITMARYNGIPAKWQSGFMTHPGALNLHDWAEVYFEGVGWVPVDQSFGRSLFGEDERVVNFFVNGMDGYRWIVNEDYGQPLFPAKIYTRSESVDFQRGELEWRGGNIYFDKWRWRFEVEYLN